MEDKSLGWWLTAIHHIRAVLALDSKDGAIEVLPDYTGVTVNGNQVPHLDSFRQRMGKDEVEKQYYLFMNNVDIFFPNFYVMPHALLIDLNQKNKRPVAPRWPLTPDPRKAMENAKRIYIKGNNGILPRLWAIHCADGWNVSVRSYNRNLRGAASDPHEEKKTRGEDKTKKKFSSRAPSETESNEGWSFSSVKRLNADHPDFHASCSKRLGWCSNATYRHR